MVLSLMRRKLSCFYSVYVIGPVLHWNLFALEVKQFNRPPLFETLGVILDPSVDMEDHIKKICKT